METQETVQLNRRDFVAATAAAGVGLCVLCSSAMAADATAPATAPSNGPVDIGLKSDFDKDGMYSKFIKSNSLVVIRDSGKIFAMSSKCTHKGCNVQEGADHLPVCNCHHSYFKIDGTVIKGPAKTPLLHYAISVDEKGHLMVDPTVKFDTPKWDDANASVSVA